ncbi:hypothetical protein ACFL4G_02460 [Thermodesulfobacteriota bacterium]
MRCPVWIAIACLATLPKSSAPTFSLHVVEPFSIDLPAESDPLELLQADTTKPIRAAVARGETSALAVLALKGLSEAGTITIEAGGAFDSKGRRHNLLDVLLIKGLPRSNRYILSLLGHERLERFQDAYPDILITSESHFDEQVKKGRSDKPLTLPREDRVAISSAMGRTKYLLVRIKIPREFTAGTVRASIVVEEKNRGVPISVPVEVTVLPFALPDHGKILSVANDFSSPGNSHFNVSLEDQAEHGMTATRLKDAFKGESKEKTLERLNELRFSHLIHVVPPRSDKEAVPKVDGFTQFFYGVDEPQPKERFGGKSWSRMADHVRLSRTIHSMGGLVTTSIPYPYALELSQQGSRIYKELKAYGLERAHEPLDWANYTLGLQHLGHRTKARQREERRRPLPGGNTGDMTRMASSTEKGELTRGRGAKNQELFDYIVTLQREYEDGATSDGRTPLSKHDWIETYYFPLGYFKSPFFARLLYGYYLFESHLDGVSAWTLYRPKGNPYTDEDGEDPVIAYPSGEGMASTYWWEAVREGANDLRYCRLAEELVIEIEKTWPQRGQEMRRRLISILAPYAGLVIDGQRIDRVMSVDSFRKTRTELVDLITELREMIETEGTGKGGAGAGGVGK